jgi:hypothetical protein
MHKFDYCWRQCYVTHLKSSKSTLNRTLKYTQMATDYTSGADAKNK